MLQRFGAQAWISFILFAWGFIGAAHGFIQQTAHFYTLRFLSGVAQGGVFPAVWYIIPMFYPPEHVTNAYSVIFAAMSFSMPLSSPLFAGLLSLGPCVNVKGWRLLFVVGGIIPMVFAVLVYICLPASPQTAPFLKTEEKEWIAESQGGRRNECDLSYWEAMKRVFSNQTWNLCTTVALIVFGICNVLMFWATLLIQDMLYGEDDEDDKDDDTCGSKHGNAALAIVMTAIPFLFCGVLCLWTRRLVVHNRPRVAAAIFAAGGGMMISWIGAQHIAAAVRFLLLTGSITAGYVGLFYVTAVAIMSCASSVHSVATSLYNAIATIGAIALPIVFGKLIDLLGSGTAISFFGGFFLIATLLVIRVEDPLLKEGADRLQEEPPHTQASPSSSSC